jgi:hypothetical protein
MPFVGSKSGSGINVEVGSGKIHVESTILFPVLTGSLSVTFLSRKSPQLQVQLTKPPFGFTMDSKSA